MKKKKQKRRKKQRIKEKKNEAEIWVGAQKKDTGPA